MTKETEELHKRVRSRIEAIEKRNTKKGFIDWDKIEFECTDKVYLSAKEALKEIDKFGSEIIVRMFERINLAKLKK